MKMTMQRYFSTNDKHGQIWLDQTVHHSKTNAKRPAWLLVQASKCLDNLRFTYKLEITIWKQIKHDLSYFYQQFVNKTVSPLQRCYQKDTKTDAILRRIGRKRSQCRDYNILNTPKQIIDNNLHRFYPQYITFNPMSNIQKLLLWISCKVLASENRIFRHFRIFRRHRWENWTTEKVMRKLVSWTGTRPSSACLMDYLSETTSIRQQPSMRSWMRSTLLALCMSSKINVTFWTMIHWNQCFTGFTSLILTVSGCTQLILELELSRYWNSAPYDNNVYFLLT